MHPYIANITGECGMNAACVFNMHEVVLISSVAGKPTNINVSKTGLSSANRFSWTHPSPSPAGYEVFYQAHGRGSRVSRGTTSNTHLDLNRLPLGSHSVFVVAFEAKGHSTHKCS